MKYIIINFNNNEVKVCDDLNNAINMAICMGLYDENIGAVRILEYKYAGGVNPLCDEYVTDITEGEHVLLLISEHGLKMKMESIKQ